MPALEGKGGLAQTPLVAVTGSQPPYVYDLPVLLSLPNGFEFRFRYHQKWVSNDVLAEVASTPGVTLQRPLIILFHSQELRRFLPLRLCSVLAIEHIGPLVFLRFAVGPFVRVPVEVVAAALDSTERRLESDRLCSIGRRLIGVETRDLTEGLAERSYLRLAAADVPDLEWVSVDDANTNAITSAWSGLAALLMNEDRLYQIPMFHLLGFQETTGEFESPRDLGGKLTLGGLSGSTPRVRGFRLVEGKHYRLRLLEWCETIKGSTRRAKLIVNAAPEVLSLQGSSNLVVGGYDVLEFSFRATRPGYTELSVGVTSLDDAETSAPTRPQPESRTWPVIYAARIPVEVRHSWARIGALIALAVAGGVLYNSHWGKFWELAGLLLMFTTLGGLLERFARFTAEIRDLPERIRIPRAQ